MTLLRPLLVIVCALLVVACGPGGETTTAADASVIRVVDGDTVVVSISGQDETVRLLGVDTPETVAPNRPVECYGPEASAALAALLPEGTEVDIVIDAEPRDRYQRLLAYVFRRDDGAFVNAELLAEGTARTLSYASTSTTGPATPTTSWSTGPR